MSMGRGGYDRTGIPEGAPGAEKSDRERSSSSGDETPRATTPLNHPAMGLEDPDATPKASKMSLSSMFGPPLQSGSTGSMREHRLEEPTTTSMSLYNAQRIRYELQGNVPGSRWLLTSDNREPATNSEWQRHVPFIHHPDLDHYDCKAKEPNTPCDPNHGNCQKEPLRTIAPPQSAYHSLRQPDFGRLEHHSARVTKKKPNLDDTLPRRIPSDDGPELSF